jgi:hypothetical protein
MNKFVNWPKSCELSSRRRRAVVYSFSTRIFGGLGSRVNERQSASVCHLSHITIIINASVESFLLSILLSSRRLDLLMEVREEKKLYRFASESPN